MANFFEQFDPAPESKPKKEENFFEQFDPKPTEDTRTPISSLFTAEGLAKFAKEAPAASLSGMFLRPLVSGAESLKSAATTGQFDPERVMESAQIGLPPSPAMGSGKFITQVTAPMKPLLGRVIERMGTEEIGPPLSAAARTIGPAPGPAYPAQSAVEAATALGTSIPRYAGQGSFGQGLAQTLARIPFVGTGLRSKSAEALQNISNIGREAATIPTGRLTLPEEAGMVIQNVAQRAKDAAETGFGEPVRGLSPNAAPEALFHRALAMAGSKSRADAQTLARLRGSVPADEWSTVQGAAINQLGKSERIADFDPSAWIRGYGNLSERGRETLFGGPGNESLKRHLDAIYEVSKAAPTMKKIAETPVSLGTGLGLSGMAAMSGVFVSPLTALGALVGPAVVARALSKPATAASVAQWSKASDALLHRPGAASIALFTIASRNLNNTLGGNSTVEDFFKALNVKVENQQRFIRDAVGNVYGYPTGGQ